MVKAGRFILAAGGTTQKRRLKKKSFNRPFLGSTAGLPMAWDGQATSAPAAFCSHSPIRAAAVVKGLIRAFFLACLGYRCRWEQQAAAIRLDLFYRPASGASPVSGDCCLKTAGQQREEQAFVLYAVT